MQDDSLQDSEITVFQDNNLQDLEIIVCKRLWYNLQDDSLQGSDMVQFARHVFGRVTVCKIWVRMWLARIWYIVLSYVACGCMTIRMRMHDLQEKRERN